MKRYRADDESMSADGYGDWVLYEDAQKAVSESRQAVGSPAVSSRWDGEKLVWRIEDIEILDTDLKAWINRNMPYHRRAHDGTIRAFHTQEWWEAWCRGDHLKPENDQAQFREERA